MSVQSQTLISSAASPSSPKPTLLCLHGGGTNANIFNIQTIRLQHILPQFSFIFLDAPFIAAAGPGVLPFFEGCDPFYRWGKDGYPGLPEETRNLVQKTIEQSEGKVVGVLGFSQGARLASGLLFEQEEKARQSKANGTGLDGKGFKFGVFLNGTSPPMTAAFMDKESVVKKELIRVPSLHVVGKEDPWREESRKLYEEFFDGETAMKVEFEVGHRLPTKKEDTERIGKEILRLWEETRNVDFREVVE